MIVKHLNPVFRILDFILVPFMWVLNGFKFPLQETHAWHTYDIDPELVGRNNSIEIDNVDKESLFSRKSPLGIYHMPLIGGLTKYAVVETSRYTRHWHIGWIDKDMAQIHKLKITSRRLKLLTTKEPWRAFGTDDKGEFVKLRIVGFGRIGDNKYSDIRLF